MSTDTNFENYRFPGATGSRNSNTYQAKQLVQRMKEGEVAKTPLRAGTSYIVFAAKKRVEADLSQLPGQKSMIRSTILGELRNASIDAFIKGLRMRYEKEGKLKIKQELIDKMFAETPNPAP